MLPSLLVLSEKHIINDNKYDVSLAIHSYFCCIHRDVKLSGKSLNHSRLPATLTFTSPSPLFIQSLLAAKI